jgi:spore coat protein U-like protein
MRVRANGGFSVTMRSQNGGALRHVDASIDAAIAYELTIDGARVDLASRRPVPAAAATGLTGLAGTLYSIAVAVAVAGGPADAVAGTYRDIISIVVTTK